MASLKGIVLQGGTYYATVKVPEDVQHAFPKKSIWRTTGTGDPREAARIGAPIREQIWKEIRAARRGTLNQMRTMPARLALAKWAANQALTPPSNDGELHTAWRVSQSVQAYERAWNDPQGYQEIEGFDETLASILRANGCRVASTDPVVAEMRPEAALTFMLAVQFAERGRLAAAFEKRAEGIRTADLDTVAIAPSKPVRELPAPSLTISKLHEEWMAVLKPADKERGRLDHQSRRLMEYFGDIPANHLEKKQVAEFMSWVARFPGRKRSAGLERLAFKELIAEFETLNAKRDHPVATLTITTVGEWFSSYRRMFEYAVDVLEVMDINPFAIKRGYVVKGAKPTKKRAFTEDEIKRIFGAPLFQGSSDGLGYRDQRGAVIIKDAKYWLPILSLHHGGRLAEFARMPLANVRCTVKDNHYFDLNSQQVKNEAAQRQIPMHPTMIKSGFVEYVLGLRAKNETWLFPELNHVTRHGAGHAFSKWWGLWMDKHDLTDPAITHHSWRHTFKRRARASAVKEELHDVITGHTSAGGVGRDYGAGAAIDDLAQEMAKITFPEFPPLAGGQAV